MKQCTKCGEVKPESEFHKKAAAKSGLMSQCKVCRSLTSQKWRENNHERHLANGLAWNRRNQDRTKKNSKEWYEKNKEKRLAQMKERYVEKKEYISAYTKQWAIKNKEKRKEQSKVYREANKEFIRKRNQEYASSNKEKLASKRAMRRAAIDQRTPQWLNAEQVKDIQSFYEVTSAFKIYTGQPYEVDHIVPLQGKTVSGLHVPWNLQVLTESENRKKHNGSWPDMW